MGGIGGFPGAGLGALMRGMIGGASGVFSGTAKVGGCSLAGAYAPNP
jgi:hypothetical protein